MRLIATEMVQADLPFLLALWQKPEVMRYADEFPAMRGWGGSDAPEAAWKAYSDKHAALGETYSQLILRLADGTPIGESFCAALAEGATWGRWCKPENVLTLLGDIKLSPQHWGQGFGTQAMSMVVRRRFDETSCGLFCVPPHRENIAAIRVYEKAGFEMAKGTRSHRNHRMMEMTRTRYAKLYVADT